MQKKKLKPDVIVFIGDALNAAEGLHRLKKFLSSLSAPLGKFAVTGSVDEWYFKKQNIFSDVLYGLEPGGFNILLHHYPDLIEDMKDYPVDLYLVGRTHEGQIALPFYGAVITLSRYGKKYESGFYQVNKTQLYVNRGLGMEGGIAPRIRFFSRPEIAADAYLP